MDHAAKTPKTLPPVPGLTAGQVADDQTGQMTPPPLMPVPGVVPVPVPPGQAKPKLKEPSSVVPGKQKEQETVGNGVGAKIGAIDVTEANKVAAEEGDEYWENYAREIELEKEIEELGGIEKVENGEVKVPEELAKEMGIKPTVEPQTPMATATGFTIRGVAFSDDQIMSGLTKPTSTGLRWLIEWFVYHLLKAHYHLKKIHGKIFRVKDAEQEK